ncbi:ATP synthase subunit beta [Azorhizobium oxalatiphilum]|uniref:ATP synthase subunit beta n=1 Tax=Azorhizobium oxalatiphilum TaxID=980631 RepID=A0A917FK01_9HYPH|nr:SAM-dependent methyltransferase [Azorhizobium oxalatiphilum]GGF88337.1 ATP synthase subunit beta [Azorhizobium oxalatiphilum]
MTAPLEAELKALIAAEGPISVGRYMALALGHPKHGYYVTRDPLGAKGDFTTAPEISQMFGELIGLWAVATWQQMGAPEAFRLVELGPGRGTLMADALRAAKLLPAFGAAMSLHMVEMSPVLRAKQADNLSAYAPTWHDRLEDMPEGPAIVIANEFFDALPIDQFVRGPQGWHERRVGLDGDDNFVFGIDPRPFPALSALATRFPAPHEGAVLERLESGAVHALAGRLATQGGAALVIDYGHSAHGYGDTLQAMKDHRFVDPLTAPGTADLTAHVDFAALAEIARGDGARAFGPLTQGEFLNRLGLAARAAQLAQNATERQRADITSAQARLAGSGQGEMGSLFKVLALGNATLGPLPGFDRQEEFAA